jgi:SPOR domain
MADDRNQQPYRGTEASQRPGAPASANDPLAELARLIGQNDPFSEFGRDGAKRAAAPRQPEAIPNWQAEPARVAPPAPQPTPYTGPDFSRQSFGSAPLAGGNDLYHVEGQTPGYAAAVQPAPGYGVPNYDVPGYGAPGYEATGFPVAPAGQPYEDDQFPAAAQHGATDDDYYDDVPPNRRRIGILAIAGIFALAVIGTAGAFGYRAVFGSSSVSSPPPVIKAEQAPSKIVPAANKDAQAKITERVNGPSERLVSREEQPVVVTTTMPPPPTQAQQPLGTGVVGSEPKRIRTIAIKPDASDAAMPTPPDSVPAPTAQPRVIATVPQRAAAAPTAAPAAAPTRLAAPAPAADAEPAPTPAPRAAAPAPRAEAPASANAPLALNPNAAPARPAPPQRAAALAPPPAAAASGGGSGVYAVQVSAQRSEEEAQAAFRSLQGKFPGQLGNRQPLIKRVDLGEKGIFFRALVGPFTDSAQASEMCSSLKSAGGSCLVQKN